MNAVGARGIVVKARTRSSLGVRVAAAIVLVAMSPQILVFLWSQVDHSVPGRMWAGARDAAEEARAIVRAGPIDREGLRRIAAKRHVRLRVLDESGELLFEEDGDVRTHGLDRVERFFLGGQSLPLAEELDAERGPLRTRPEVLAAVSSGLQVACESLPIVLCQAIATTRPTDGPRRIIHVVISSSRSVDAVYALRFQLVRLALITAPFGLVLAFVTARRIVRPIDVLRRQALERASAETLTPTLDADGGDEVGSLAEAFNALLLALDRRRRDNQTFVEDLVHQMKSPVAAVRAAAESLETGPLDRERALRLSRVLTDSTVKLDALVTQFLELARAEAGLPTEERTAVDLSLLLSGLVAALRDDARHPLVTFALLDQGGPPLAVYAVPHRIDALFRELLENAASFAGEGGRVTVTLTRTLGDAVVVVSDSGPGIRDEDLARVFTRFFTTRGHQRGTGLGLALVRAVVEAHGGDIGVSSVDGQGASFRVRLPAL